MKTNTEIPKRKTMMLCFSLKTGHLPSGFRIPQEGVALAGKESLLP